MTLRPAAIIALFCGLLSAGCVDLGPKYGPPRTAHDVPGRYQHDDGAGRATALARRGAWWRDFNDPEIDRLVKAALRGNLDLQKNAAQLLELKAGVISARADRFPSLNLQVQQRKQGQYVSSPIPGAGETFVETDSTSLTLPASFELDLWGRLAKTHAAAREDLLAAEEARLTLMQSIVAEAVSLYLRVESFERRIAVTEKTIANYRRNLEMITNRYEHGLTSILDLHQAARILAQAEAALPALQQELGDAQQKLSTLAGRYPKTRPARAQPDDYFPDLAPVPPGLPSELLFRRPDVRSAADAYEAAALRVGAARAARFPRITLTGSYGYATDELDRLFTVESSLWNLALGLTRPIFDAGKLKSAELRAKARLMQQEAEFAKTVLNAFAEVESALMKRKLLRQRRAHLLTFVQEAADTARSAQSRYERGLVDYLTLLDAQQALYQAEENLIQAELAILVNRVNLYRALGGGWPAGVLKG